MTPQELLDLIASVDNPNIMVFTESAAFAPLIALREAINKDLPAMLRRLIELEQFLLDNSKLLRAAPVPADMLTPHCLERFANCAVWLTSDAGERYLVCQVRNIRDESGVHRDVFFPISQTERLFQDAAGEVSWNGPVQCHLTAADFVDGAVPG